MFIVSVFIIVAVWIYAFWLLGVYVRQKIAETKERWHTWRHSRKAVKVRKVQSGVQPKRRLMRPPVRVRVNRKDV